MTEEEFVAYKDVSELKKDLEGMKGKKDVSPKELHDAVQKLAQTISSMLEVFAAAAEQMNLEERGHESEAKKHEMIIFKLDKIIDQNRTIAEAMVSMVDMIKEKLVAPAKEKEEPLFKPRGRETLFKPEPKPFMQPQPEWKPKPEPVQRAQPIMELPIPPPQMAQPMPPPTFDFGMQMPPMQPEPPPDLDFPEEPLPLEEEPKKKSLFGMFKK